MSNDGQNVDCIADCRSYLSLPFDRYLEQHNFHHIDVTYPGVQLINEEPFIFVVHDFLSSAECASLIDKICTSTQQVNCVYINELCILSIQTYILVLFPVHRNISVTDCQQQPSATASGQEELRTSTSMYPAPDDVQVIFMSSRTC